MLPFIAAVLAASPRLLISPSETAVTGTVANGITGYAVYKLDADGFEYTNVSGSDATANGQDAPWLDIGAASMVWVEHTVNSGSLNHQDPGAGRLL